MHVRVLLERVFGYSQPEVLANGEIEYRCAFCDACAGCSTPDHHPLCSYWQASPFFDSPAAKDLIARWAAGGPPATQDNAQSGYPRRG